MSRTKKSAPCPKGESSNASASNGQNPAKNPRTPDEAAKVTAKNQRKRAAKAARKAEKDARVNRGEPSAIILTDQESTGRRQRNAGRGADGCGDGMGDGEEGGAGPGPSTAASRARPTGTGQLDLDADFIGLDDSNELDDISSNPTHSTTTFNALPRSILTSITDLPSLSTTPAGSPPPTHAPNPISSSRFTHAPSTPSTEPTGDMPGLAVASLGKGKVAKTLKFTGDNTTAQTPQGGEERNPYILREDGLTLPGNVELAGQSGEANNGEDGEEGHDEEDEVELDGLHFVDSDIVRGASRYFDPTADDNPDSDQTFLANADLSKLCRNCRKPGHTSFQCPHVICILCGAMDQHDKSSCPYRMVCFNCGTPGHSIQECKEPKTNINYCELCRMRDHRKHNCPTLWRIYDYYTPAERKARQAERASASEWTAEAIGADANVDWCYNCALDGHLGDDCPERRGSLATRSNTAFSRTVAATGPYRQEYRSYLRSSVPQGTHKRFDDDEPPLLLGQHRIGPPGGGVGGRDNWAAGRAGREKQKAAMQRADRERDDLEDVEWPVDRRREGMNIRGRGYGRASTGGQPGRDGPVHTSTPTGPRGAQRPWDSDVRDRRDYRGADSWTPGSDARGGGGGSGMPFGHAHLMSPANGRNGGGSGAGPSTAPPPTRYAAGPQYRGGYDSPQISFGKISGSSMGLRTGDRDRDQESRTHGYDRDRDYDDRQSQGSSYRPDYPPGPPQSRYDYAQDTPTQRGGQRGVPRQSTETYNSMPANKAADARRMMVERALGISSAPASRHTSPAGPSTASGGRGIERLGHGTTGSKGRPALGTESEADGDNSFEILSAPPPHLDNIYRNKRNNNNNNDKDRIDNDPNQSSRKKRRRQPDVGDENTDYENEWRRSGMAGTGGSVVDWGKEEDEMERMERKRAKVDGRQVKGDGGARYGGGAPVNGHGTGAGLGKGKVRGNGQRQAPASTPASEAGETASQASSATGTGTSTGGKNKAKNKNKGKGKAVDKDEHTDDARTHGKTVRKLAQGEFPSSRVGGAAQKWLAKNKSQSLSQSQSAQSSGQTSPAPQSQPGPSVKKDSVKEAAARWMAQQQQTGAAPSGPGTGTMQRAEGREGAGLGSGSTSQGQQYTGGY